MKLHYLQHVPFENPAYILNFCKENDIDVSSTALYNDDKLPEQMDFDLLLIMGGPMGIHDEDQYPWIRDEKLFIKKSINEGKKILGICLGAQLIADALGSKIYKNEHKEIGWFPLKRSNSAKDSAIGTYLPENFTAFHWHGDTFDLPEGAIHLCSSEACVNQAFIYDERVLALQFHLESTRESINLLAENCGHEIDDSKYVQEKKEITSTDFLNESNKIMEEILNFMFDKILCSIE